MSQTIIQLQKEISAEERAIRHLIGERKALKSKIARLEALIKLQTARLHKMEHSKTPKLAVASRFPDVSNNQPNVDVLAVKRAASVRVGQLLVTKITEGTGFVDQPGIERARAMAIVGFERRGFYAFLHPSVSGVAQAEFLLNTLHNGGVTLKPTDILFGDCEVSDGQSAAAVARCAKDFGTTLQQHFEGEIDLYGGGPFLRENGVTLDGYDFHWLAAYVPNPAPFIPFGARTKYWQFTDGKFGPSPHSCPGIGACDLSIVLH